MRDFISWAAFLAALPAPSAAFPAPLAAFPKLPAPPAAPSEASPKLPTASAVSWIPEPFIDFLPVNSSVNALKALPTVSNLLSKKLITLITGVKMLIKPDPTLAIKLSNCSFIILTWLAQLSDVLAKSPLASESLSVTNANRKATFSASDISCVVFPKPLAIAYASSAD